MTHNEKRTVWWKEGIIGAFLGFQSGLITVAFGQPFDTLKTKMQASNEFKTLSFRQSLSKVYSAEGIRGLYRGGTSIALGSSIYRIAQFSVFEGCYSRFEPQNLKHQPYEGLFLYKIPFTFGLEVRTVFAGVVSGLCRSIIECPFEFIKIRKQVNAFSWKKLNIYHGIGPLMIKNSMMVSLGFCLIDSFRRNTNAWSNSFTIFLASGLSTIISHLIIWPVEIFRTTYTARNKGESGSMNKIINDHIIQHGRLGGYFRGALPGFFSIFLRNGVGMVLIIKVQKLISHLGLRE